MDRQSLTRYEAYKILQEAAKEFGYKPMGVTLGPEGVGFYGETILKPKGAEFTLPPTTVSPQAVYHEIGHMILARKHPVFTATSILAEQMTPISPLAAGLYLYLAHRYGKLSKKPLRHILTAVGIWKLPHLVNVGEEFAANIKGMRYAKEKNLPGAEQTLKANLKYLLTYL